MKKSLMATWEDLDNESESDKDDAEDEANIAMGLVATVEDEKESSDVAGVFKRKRKAEVLVPGQWLLATHDGRKVYVPNPDHERGRNCGIWRKPN